MLRDAPTSSSFRDSLPSSPVRPAAEPLFRSFEPLSSHLRHGSCPVSARSALSLSLSPRHREGWREKSGPRIYSRGSCHFFSREGAIADRDHRFPLLVPLEFAHRLPRARARFIVLLPSPRPFRSLENCRDSLSRFLRRKEREYLP